MKLSVVVPARNEASSIVPTIEALASKLSAEEIPFEILVVDDHSSDATAATVARSLRGPAARATRSAWADRACVRAVVRACTCGSSPGCCRGSTWPPTTPAQI